MAGNIDSFETYMKQGDAFFKKHFLMDALVSFKQALGLFPNSVSALYNVAKIQRDLGNYQEALEYLEALFKIQGEDAAMEAHGMALEISKKSARWDIHQRELNYIKTHIGEKGFLQPFILLSEPFTNKEIYADTSSFIRANPSFSPKPVYYSFHNRTFKNRKIKVAFMSADFCGHPVSYVISGLFENMDTELFKVYLYDADPKNPDNHERKKRVQTENVCYQRVSKLKDREIADQIFKDEIDILIDMNGFTSSNKLAVLTYRPAPIQATFLGYSGTIGGVPGVDYIICDSYILPPSEQKFYSEKFAYLPCFFTYDVKDTLNPFSFDRQSFGLPKDAVVLACFCNDYKYTAEYVDCWIKILKSVPNTVLWIFIKNRYFEQNFSDYIKKAGISEKRIVYAYYLPSHADHLARYRCADLLLDTQYYNAHTTAAEALFAGCPLITCPGKTFASRVSGSILTALGMEEMICKNLEEYEEKIIDLASDKGKLLAIRQKLDKNKMKSKFFDNKCYADKFGELCIKLLNEYIEK